mmetsp:Transcript_65600/g.150302  ORF Transcript_65600/g.150302 Transcript_65600/m.150302 type:complete len:257 (+) Transcript_65600:524-1294(+)
MKQSMITAVANPPVSQMGWPVSSARTQAPPKATRRRTTIRAMTAQPILLFPFTSVCSCHLLCCRCLTNTVVATVKSTITTPIMTVFCTVGTVTGLYTSSVETKTSATNKKVMSRRMASMDLARFRRDHPPVLYPCHIAASSSLDTGACSWLRRTSFGFPTSSPAIVTGPAVVKIPLFTTTTTSRPRDSRFTSPLAPETLCVTTAPFTCSLLSSFKILTCETSPLSALGLGMCWVSPLRMTSLPFRISKSLVVSAIN